MGAGARAKARARLVGTRRRDRGKRGDAAGLRKTSLKYPTSASEENISRAAVLSVKKRPSIFCQLLCLSLPFIIFHCL